MNLLMIFGGAVLMGLGFMNEVKARKLKGGKAPAAEAATPAAVAAPANVFTPIPNKPDVV